MSPNTRPAAIPMVTARDVDRPETRCSVSSVVRPSSSGEKPRPALLFSMNVFSSFFLGMFLGKCLGDYNTNQKKLQTRRLSQEAVFIAGVSRPGSCLRKTKQR